MAPECKLAEYIKSCRGDCRHCVEAGLQRVLRDKGYADFDVLRVESIIEAPLVNESPLHVGSGAESLSSPIDHPVVRVGRRLPNGEIVYEPVIPGSSLKGVLRSLVEAYAVARGMLKPAVEIEGLVLRCTGDGLSEVEEFLGKDKLCKILRKSNGEDAWVDTTLCEGCLASPVIGLFGAPWLASHIYFLDARPENDVTVSTVTRVSIDRLTGGQAPQLLYTLEYVEPGYRWRFRVRIVNITPDDKERWELLHYMFHLLESGVQLGGRTSTGLGLVRLLVDEGKVRLIRVTSEGLREDILRLPDWLEGAWLRR